MKWYENLDFLWQGVTDIKEIQATKYFEPTLIIWSEIYRQVTFRCIKADSNSDFLCEIENL